MRKTIHKLFWLWDFDKEEKWLDEMSSIGLHLVGVGWCRYVFEEGTPGEYAVRLEMLKHWPSHPESERYIRFVEETGAEYLGSLKNWVYFRKKREEGGFDLYSDIESRIRHLNRCLTLNGVVGVMELAYTVFYAWYLWRYRHEVSILVLWAFLGGLSLFLGYGFVRLSMKKARLKKDRALHE